MEFDIYKDINERTKGEIYMGVVGPVRTGKSTFIKRFMRTSPFGQSCRIRWFHLRLMPMNPART